MAEPDIKPPKPCPGMEKPLPDYHERLSQLKHRHVISDRILAARLRSQDNDPRRTTSID